MRKIGFGCMYNNEHPNMALNGIAPMMKLVAA